MNTQTTHGFSLPVFNRITKTLVLLSLFLSLGAGTIWAENVDFSAQGYTNQQEITSYTGTTFSVAFAKGTNSNASKYFTSGTAIRCYGGNTITLSASSGNLTAFTITFGSSDGTNAITADVGTYTNGSWSGTAATVVLTISGSSGNRRIAGFTGVTTSGGGGTPTLSSISVQTPPTKTTYTAGETFDPTGLVITRTYSSGSPDTYTYAGHTSEFTFSPTTSTALTTADDKVTITYGGKTVDQAITVNSSGGGAGTGTINFGSATGSTKIDGISVTGDDNLGNTWTISTVMSETSFTQSSDYSQVGSSKKPATSITFEMDLGEEYSVTSLSADFGGFNGTAGDISLEIDDNEVGTGALSTSSDVTISAPAAILPVTGQVLKVTVTNITAGVKCYGISYTIASAGPAIDAISVKTAPTTSYTERDYFDPTGLVINVEYEDGTDEDVAYTSANSGKFAFSPSTTTQLTTADDHVTITYGGKSVNLTISVAALTPRTYTFYPGSGTCTTSTLTESAYEDGVELPTATAPAGCDPEYTFAGWATASVSETTTRPALFAAGTNYNGSDLNLYAVYKQSSGGSGFTLSIEVNGTTYYVGGRTGTNKYLNATTTAASAATFDIVEQNGSKYLCWIDGANTYYLYTGTSSSADLSFTTDVTTALYDWTITEGSTIYFESNGNARALALNTNANPIRFAAYLTSSNTDNEFIKSGSGTTTYNSNPECVCTSVNITYNANGGTLADGCSNVSAGACDRDWQLCAAPTKTGYIFSGWKDQSGTIYEAEAEVQSLRKSLTLTAQWVENPYTVNFDPGNGSCNKTSLTESSRGSGVKLPSATPVGQCSGEWRFVGWTRNQLTGEDNTSYTLAGVANEMYIPTTNNETLYAVYSKLDISGSGDVEFSKYTGTSIEEGLYVLVIYQAEGSYGRLKYATPNSGRIPYTKEWTAAAPASIIINSPSISDDVFQLSNADGKWLLYNMGQETYLGAGSGGNLTWSARTSALTYTAAKESTIDWWQFQFVDPKDEKTYYLSANPTSDYFRNYALSTLGNDPYRIMLYKGAEGTTYYSCAPQCVACTDPEWSFRDGEHVVRALGSSNYTNIVDKKFESTGAKTYKSSNEAVATVNASTGEVTMLSVGSTIITLKLAKTSTYCAQVLQYELEVKNPSMEVVEITKTTDPNNPSDPTEYYGAVIEHDLEGETSIVIKERETTLVGEYANDLFISKYFEAASNMKLFAIFNGTDHDIDISNIRIRCNCGLGGNTVWPTTKGDFGYLELKDVSKLRDDYPDLKIPSGTELIFWSNNKKGQATTVMNCINMTINGTEYDYSNMEANEIPNWYCIGRYDIYGYSEPNLLPDADGNNQFIFNGDDSMILERYNEVTTSWDVIDLFGAGTASAPASVADLKTAGYIKTVNTEYNINGTNQKLNDDDGFYAVCDGITIPYSTNRYMLIRKKTVKDGLHAVASNASNFATLCEEWDGTPVGGSTSGSGANNPYCYSGRCFSDIAQYDYAKQYVNWVDLPPEKLSAIDNGDGTKTIIIKDMEDRACTSLQITVTNSSSEVIAESEFKIPIIVNGDKQTDNDLFYEQHDACATCDVIIMDGGVLTKAANDASHDKAIIRNLDIYAGGKVVVPSGTHYTVNNLTFRSRVAEDGLNMDFPELVINGELEHKAKSISQRIRVDDRRFYNFVVPYPVRISQITFSTGEEAVYGEDYIIDIYDGEKRAETQAGGCWTHFDGEILHPGVGYTLAVAPKSGHTYADLVFPMPDGDLSIGEPDTKTLNIYAWGTSETRANHKGWNLIGNPYLQKYLKNNIYAESSEMLTTGKLEPDPEHPGWWKSDNSSIPYVTVINSTRDDYTQEAVELSDLPPFTTFFVQVGKSETASGSKVELTFNKGHRANMAQRYRKEAEQPSVTKAGLLLTGENIKDNFGVIVGEQYGPTYDMQADLSKEFGTTYSLKAYTLQDGDKLPLAFEAVHPDRLTQPIPVGVRLPKNGSYTFKADERYNLGAFEHIYLSDNITGKHVDLLDENYSFDGIKTKVDNRFSLTLVLRPKTPTDIDRVVSGIAITSRTGALMLSGLPDKAEIYIYDMAGRMITTDYTHDQSTAVYAVPTGVYQVRVVADNNNALLRTIVY